ncbi:unnamed protein product [Caretta caretta]
MDSEVQMSENPPAAATGEQILKDFQVLIEKVGGKPEVLLVGESQEGKDTRALMAAFVQELFPDACKPGVSPAMAAAQTQSEAKPGASNSQSQLIFFLCRAASLRGKQAEIQKILKEVKKFSRRAPAALVGVIVQPKKEEETEARKLMESVLQGAFPRQPHKRDKRGRKRGQALELEEVQVEVEVFVPGRPRGKLAIMKAACRASEALQQRTSADVKRDEDESLVILSHQEITLQHVLSALCIWMPGGGYSSISGWLGERQVSNRNSGRETAIATITIAFRRLESHNQIGRCCLGFTSHPLQSPGGALCGVRWYYWKPVHEYSHLRLGSHRACSLPTDPLSTWISPVIQNKKHQHLLLFCVCVHTELQN